MTDIEAIYDENNDNEYPNYRTPGTKRAEYQCRYCRAKGLRWFATSNGWRLHEPNGGGAHRCYAYLKTKAT